MASVLLSEPFASVLDHSNVIVASAGSVCSQCTDDEPSELRIEIDRDAENAPRTPAHLSATVPAQNLRPERAGVDASSVSRASSGAVAEGGAAAPDLVEDILATSTEIAHVMPTTVRVERPKREEKVPDKQQNGSSHAFPAKQFDANAQSSGDGKSNELGGAAANTDLEGAAGPATPVAATAVATTLSEAAERAMLVAAAEALHEGREILDEAIREIDDLEPGVAATAVATALRKARRAAFVASGSKARVALQTLEAHIREVDGRSAKLVATAVATALREILETLSSTTAESNRKARRAA
jgi:hypothetical protein